jgi:2-dehydropantoate 2-reductase
MRICVAGAGAIGSYLACKLSRTAAEVSVMARGPRAAAIRAHGITLTDHAGGEVLTRPAVIETGDGAPQDWVFVCVKAYAVPEIAPALGALIGPETRVVFVQNGLPWWYEAGNAAGSERLDPGGRIAAVVARDRVVGCVTYSNVRNFGPGKAHHVGDDTFILGQPDGIVGPTLERIVAVLREGGIEAKPTGDIRREIWLKLWGSLAFNPISALTGATMDRIIGDAETRPLVMAMMTEARAVAERLGVDLGATVEQRLETAARAGAFKTSMLQDVEAGRRLEIDAILGAVADAARAVGVEAPTIGAVLGLSTQKADVLGLR